jgi:hypothetical protein
MHPKKVMCFKAGSSENPPINKLTMIIGRRYHRMPGLNTDKI